MGDAGVVEKNGYKVIGLVNRKYFCDKLNLFQVKLKIIGISLLGLGFQVYLASGKFILKVA